jgi:hypothetical protein
MSRLNLPCIGDIQTTDLLYFDEQHISACYAFCIKRDIDCLPIIGDPSAFYEKNPEAETFDKRELVDDRWLDAQTFLFSPNLLDCFRHFAVQFVFTEGEQTGVVHFSDYNNDAVSYYLFAQIAKYERGLRELAVINGLKNHDMKTYFEEMKNSSEKSKERKFYEKRLAHFDSKKWEMEKVDEFQVFYLDDLIGLLEYKDIIDLDDDVYNLRNMVMHAGSLINKVDVHAADYIYDYGSFELFFKRAATLLNDSKRVYNRIVLSKGG